MHITLPFLFCLYECPVEQRFKDSVSLAGEKCIPCHLFLFFMSVMLNRQLQHILQKIGGVSAGLVSVTMLPA
jgi:hypothetical protein